MNPIVRNILAVVAGLLIGSTVNMGLITIGHSVLPVEGIDPNDMEAYTAAMPTLEAKYFLFPFLAHALGTLSGALVAALIAATHKMKFAFAIGVLFLFGGITAVIMMAAPMWFNITDLLLAYIPMGWIGGKIATRNTQNS